MWSASARKGNLQFPGRGGEWSRVAKRSTLRYSCSIAAAATLALSCGGRTHERNDDNSSARDGASEPGIDIELDTTAGDEITPVAPGAEFDVCTGVSVEPENTMEPADIIFLVDNSPSMRDEILWTRRNMNLFSQAITDGGIDHRIVMISCLQDGCDGHRTTSGICIDPPLGSGDCETSDTNLPDYLHVDVRMPSQKLLERAVDTFAEWQTMIRPFARTHIVAISDDSELMDAAEFREALVGLGPPVSDFVFHGIFAALGKDDACAISSSEPCCTYAAPDGEGVQYQELVDTTGGVAADLCEQDFEPVFTQFAESVIAHSELDCEWTIPSPPEGEAIDPELVNVEFKSGDSSTYFGYVASRAECDDLDNAWYYDAPGDPQRVLVCPDTCARIRAAPVPRLSVTFGCKTLEIAEIQ